MEEQQLQHENKMGTMHIPQLLFSMALPAIISMFVQAMYNIVDSVFVAQTGENALTAVSLAFPVQMLIVSCFVGMGVGINSGISRRLGEKKHREAEMVAEHGFLVAVILSLAAAILGAAFSNVFVKMFTDNPEIIKGCTDYLLIVTIFSFGSIITQAGFSTLQGSGDMIQPMIGQLIGAITNIILDPIMIFGLLGFPALGVTGAAIATVTGQIIAMVYILIVVLKRKKNLLKLHFRSFKYRGAIMKDIAVVGLPSAIMQGIGSFMVTGYNLILAGYGMTAVAVFGVYFKVQSFIFMPIFGLGQGAMPIFGYNYGAQNAKRFKETLKVSILTSLVIMFVGVLLFQLFPAQIFMLFNASEEMTAIGINCFRAISLAFPLAGISIMLSTSFQAMGKSYLSMISSFLRQMIFLLPFSYLFSLIGGLDTVWYGFIVSEIACLVFEVIVYRHYKKKVLDRW
ncbi:MATE family efflux transporter [Eubacterium limosum]|uniref:MATE family efflux transporter n=1 Tax=Eubacterium limosum TaxID=1736 RepID=UPI001FA9DE2C|nr:MATE family efflux transporter [Eubacterium limosum]